MKLYIGAFAIGNNGITMPTPANTTALSEKMLSTLTNDMRLKADMYADRMKRWLCKNSLPEYVSSSDVIVNPQKVSNSGWYVPSVSLTEDEYVLWQMRKNRI